ncbi:hypothetical protein H1R20_g12010, partial [Candolleomyces eurysporus]
MSTEPTTLVLVFEPDNPCNTIITDQQTGKELYTVGTEHNGPESVTKIFNDDNAQLAQWVWKDLRSDKVTLGQGQPMSASAWLRKSILPFKDTVYFTDLNGRNFKWKGNAHRLGFELYSETDKKNPVARFKKSYRYKDHKQSPPKEVYDPATLTIAGLGLEILDTVVISFCILDKERRARGNGAGEHGAANTAASVAIPLSAIVITAN